LVRRFLLQVLTCFLEGCMNFLIRHGKCFFNLRPYTVKPFPQNLVGRISSVAGSALRGFSAALRAKIRVITDFFAAVGTINQIYSPLIMHVSLKI